MMAAVPSGSDVDLTADVVVLGLGAAGVAAALTAAEAGADVLVLEKQAEDRHTPSAAFAGSMIMVTLDEDKATRYLVACADGGTPEPECRAWARGAADLQDWLMRRCPGLTVHDLTGHHAGPIYPDLPGADGVVTREFRMPGQTAGSGELLHRALLDRAVATGRVRIRWASPAEELLRADDGRVTGVRAADGTMVRARGGVVLATGGFENDPQACRTYLWAWPTYFTGNPDNTGDGLRMAMALGTDLWHMTVAIGRQCTHVQGPDGRWHNYQMGLTYDPFIVVDGEGRRYCDESAYVRIHTTWHEMQLWDHRTRSFSRVPSYWVFDSRRFARRLAAGPEPARSTRPRWSDDNLAELKRGWVVSGSTVRELGENLNLPDPAVLVRTVEEFAAGAARGEDPFGRPAETLVPLDRPPYYAVRLFPGGVNTAGGPRHDAHGRVLDVRGAPIAGLFAAGTVSQLIGRVYPSPGAGWSEALTTGRIAGAAAARGVGDLLQKIRTKPLAKKI